MKLVKPTDTELNAAFAEHVEGWTYLTDNAPRGYGWYVGDAKVVDADGSDMGLLRPLRFTDSADAVLPHLEKRPWDSSFVEGQSVHGNYMVRSDGHMGRDNSFPRAAVIALLRAHRVEVET